jgi:hypothetical protein
MLIVFLVSILLVVIVVAIHLKILVAAPRVLQPLQVSNQLKISLGVIILICAHVIEIGIFALALYLLSTVGRYGRIEGDMRNGFADYAYFSLVNYTTVGFGDYIPVGLLRFVSGVEALTGLLLIASSASFAFTMMSRFWQDRIRKEEGGD